MAFRGEGVLGSAGEHGKLSFSGQGNTAGARVALSLAELPLSPLQPYLRTVLAVPLAGLRQTLFMGNTLRGLLLYGYAFATMGTIAGIAAIGAFGAGGLLLLLFLFGLWHARRAEQTVERPVSARAVPQPV